jgi:glyceraldehyde-3-phosphate dehydrogenase/erythrose-4-phosphate dehydrogenase
MKNTNSTQHEKVKAILEKTTPDDFNINMFIDEVTKMKNEDKKIVSWVHDEWDNWHDNF